MSDWKHEDLKRLMDEVREFEPIDPSTVDHPSRRELAAYVDETVSPFMARWIAGHADTCEVCSNFLLQAYEVDETSRRESAASDRATPFLVAGRGGAATWLRPAALAATWILAIPAGAWLASFVSPEPVTVQAGLPASSPAAVSGPSPTDEPTDEPSVEAVAAQWGPQDLAAVEKVVQDVVRSVMSEQPAPDVGPPALDVEALVRRVRQSTDASLEARFAEWERGRRQDMADVYELYRTAAAGGPCAAEVLRAEAPAQPKPFFGYRKAASGETE